MPAAVNDIRSATSGKWWTLVATLCAAGVALRLAAIPRALGDLDAVNFASGLRHFDVFSQAPHFPGYPVFIAAAGAVRWLGVQSDTWALALPGIVLWPPAACLLFEGLRRRLGAGPAAGAVALGSIAPGAVLVSAWPCSDGLGLTLAAAAVGLLALGGRRATLASGLVFGLLLGVRLSWWPLVLAAGLGVILLDLKMRDGGASLRLIASGGLGVAAWLVPMLVWFPPAELAALAVGFSAGHMSDWGGTAFAAQASGPLARLSLFAGGLWSSGLGAAGSASASPPAAGAAGSCIAGLAVLGLVSASASRRRRVLLTALLLGLPYALWLVGAQNVAKPRHLLPLLPLLGVLLAAGLTQPWWGRLRAPLAGAALLALAVVSAARAHHQAAHPVPALAFTEFLRGRAPAGLLVFAGQEARVARHYVPMYRVVRPAGAAALEEEAARAGGMGVEVWVTSAAPGFEEVSERLEPLRSFDYPRALRPHDGHLVLYRYRIPPVTASTRLEVHR